MTTRNPGYHKQNIIDVAKVEFAEFGLSGARVERIAAKMRTSKRMLYYYFQDKEGLYREVISSFYEKLHAVEAQMNLHNQAPIAALQALVEFNFDYHLQNAELIRVIVAENIQNRQHISDISKDVPVNTTILDQVEDICRRGVAEGSMRRGLDVSDLCSIITALCFFNASDRRTFRTIFQCDVADKNDNAARRALVWDVVRRAVIVQPGE